MKWCLTIFLIYCLSYGHAEIDLSNIEIPDLDDISVIRERCNTKGGNGTFDKVKTAKDNLQSCLQGLIDFSVLKKEVEEAKKTGSMDDVFGKYCRKRSIASNCVHNFTETIKPCLEDSEKDALNTTLDILKQLGEFACHGDGDRIALFVAEGGVECIRDHGDGIKDCVNKTFKIDTTSDSSAFPNLLIDRKRCDDLGKLQSCVVEELEKCSDSTPANIVDALLRFIKRSACNKKTKRSIHRLLKRNTKLPGTYNTDVFTQNLIQLLQGKCEQNAPEGGYKAFQDALDWTIDCLRRPTDRYPAFSLPFDQLKNRLQNCTSDLIVKAENCLSNAEKYYPQFYFDVTYSVLDFLYDNRPKIISGQFSTETMNCLQNFNKPDAQKSLMTCLNSTSFEVDHVYTRQETCDRLVAMKTCVTKEMNKVCVKDVEIAKLQDDFFKAVTAPCNKKKDQVN